MARALGIDHGDRRFGVAISDFGASLASPRKVVEGEEALLRYLQELIPQEEVATIVVGLPLNMDGTTGGQAKKVLAFVVIERITANSSTILAV